MDHKILLARAKQYGMSGQTLQWLTESVANGIQTVVVEGKKSSFSLVISGFPQSTILGPILFTLYIDVQPGTLETSLGKILSNDTKLNRKIIDMAVKILVQKDLANVISYVGVNNKQLNEEKFEAMETTLPENTGKY